MTTADDRGPALRARVPKAAHLLADELRRHILVEHLEEGAALPGEQELIARSGFSRATVREALRQLEAEGLVSIRRGPAGGVRVAHPDTGHVTRSLAVALAISRATLRDLFDFREALEPAAAALAAAAASADQRAALLTEADGAPDELVAHNVAFHRLVARSTGNEFHRLTLAAVLEITLWHSLEDRLSADDLAAATQAHRRIARAIADGDPEAAAATSRRHIAGFRRLMEEQGRLDTPILLRTRADWLS